MIATMKLQTTVLPGHRIEFTNPKLTDGADVEITITLPMQSDMAERRQRFNDLATRWHSETAALSSVSQMAMYPAYQEVIGMGREALPLILEELQKTPDHWFWALRAITGEDPIRPEQRGRLQEMVSAWIEWGKERGYVS